MKRSSIRVVLLLSCIVAASVVSGCTTPLEKYILAHGYEPFVVPRDADGVGTLITFQNGHERTLARDTQCFGSAATDAQANPRRVALEQYEYMLDKTNTIEFNLPLAIGNGLDLRAAVQLERIQRVRIRLIQPFEQLASVKTFADAIGDLDATCRTLALDPDHFVISQVLGAAGVEYEFFDAGGSIVILDAAILRAMGASTDLQTRFQGTRFLNIDFPIFIGYQLLHADELPGVDEGYTCRPVPLRTIRALKDAL